MVKAAGCSAAERSMVIHIVARVVAVVIVVGRVHFVVVIPLFVLCTVIVLDALFAFSQVVGVVVVVGGGVSSVYAAVLPRRVRFGGGREEGLPGDGNPQRSGWRR
jgi:hypothetical protein